MLRAGFIVAIVAHIALAPVFGDHHSLSILEKLNRECDDYYLVFLNDRLIGNSTIQLHRSGDGYEYRHEVATRVNHSTYIYIGAEAELDRSFRPRWIGMFREAVVDGRTDSDLEVTIEIRDKKMLLTKIENGDELEQILDIPEDDFVFGVECLLQQYKFAEFSEFELKEIDPMTGDLDSLEVTVVRWQGGHRAVVRRDGSEDSSMEAMHLDGDGSLSKYDSLDTGLEERHTTRREFDEVSDQLDL